MAEKARTQKLLGARTRVALAFNKYMTSSSQSIIGTKLGNLWPHCYSNFEKSQQYAFGLYLEMPKGKKNPDYPLFSGFVRNTDVELCPVGALAFYFLELWPVCVMLGSGTTNIVGNGLSVMP